MPVFICDSRTSCDISKWSYQQATHFFESNLMVEWPIYVALVQVQIFISSLVKCCRQMILGFYYILLTIQFLIKLGTWTFPWYKKLSSDVFIFADISNKWFLIWIRQSRYSVADIIYCCVMEIFKCELELPFSFRIYNSRLGEEGGVLYYLPHSLTMKKCKLEMLMRKLNPHSQKIQYNVYIDCKWVQW